MTARQQVLARIRSRLGRDGVDDKPVRTEGTRGQPIRPVVADDLAAHFIIQAKEIAATVEVVGSPDRVPGAIGSYLASKRLRPKVTTGGDPWLAGLPWQEAGIEVTIRQTREGEPVAVSHAAFAVAETGTVVLASGADNPVTLNFLPENHIVIVERSRVVAYQEEVWPMFREQGMPRALSFITGPSRTGDIEFDIQLGAHGPKNLHIIIVASDRVPSVGPMAGGDHQRELG